MIVLQFYGAAALAVVIVLTVLFLLFWTIRILEVAKWRREPWAS